MNGEDIQLDIDGDEPLLVVKKRLLVQRPILLQTEEEWEFRAERGHLLDLFLTAEEVKDIRLFLCLRPGWNG